MSVLALKGSMRCIDLLHYVFGSLHLTIGVCFVSLQWFDNMTMYLSVLGNMRAHLEVDALGQLKVISAGARNSE